MSRPGITYEDVTAACEHLNSEGQAPTVRRLRAELGGGSNTTLLTHLNRWQQQRRAALQTDTHLPAKVVEALNRALAETSASARAERETEVAELNAQLAEAIQLLGAAEQATETLNEALAQVQADKQTATLAAEKALAAECATSDGLRAELKDAREKAQAAISGQEAARIEAAKAQLQVERADKAADLAQTRAAEQAQTIERVMGALAEAQKVAAVAEAHTEEQRAANAKLTADLAERKGELTQARKDYRAAETARREPASPQARANGQKTEH